MSIDKEAIDEANRAIENANAVRDRVKTNVTTEANVALMEAMKRSKKVVEGQNIN